MRKISFVFAAFLFLSIFTGCSSGSAEVKSQANMYLEMAQQLIDADELDSAISVLEEGIRTTDDDALKAKLKEISDEKDAFSSTNNTNNTEDTTIPQEVTTSITTSVTDTIASTTQTTNSTGNDYRQFVGEWAESSLYETGGITLEVFTLEGEYGTSLLLDVYSFSSADDSTKVAYISEEFTPEDIRENTLTIEYEDDCWGNSGTLVIIREEDHLICQVIDVSYDSTANWAVYEGSYTLIPLDDVPVPEVKPSNYFYNDSAPELKENQIRLQPTYIYWENDNLIAECYVINGFAHSVTSVSFPSLILSNDYGTIASGDFDVLTDLTLEPNSYTLWKFDFSPENVLLPNATLTDTIYTTWSYEYEKENFQTPSTLVASEYFDKHRVSEQEFRNNCIYLGSSYNKYNEYTYAAGRSYYSEHPEENKYQDKYTAEWEDYALYGKKSKSYDEYNRWELEESTSLDEYLNMQIFGPKGAKLLGNASEAILQQMREYPDEYKGNCYILAIFRVEGNRDYCYTNEDFVVYNLPITVVDWRDNFNSPTVLQSYRYNMYVIFTGTYTTYSGVTGLEFALLSLDKCE